MEYYGTSLWAPTNTLSHHGIKGMKWGIRRYQNEDGSLTPAGCRRYGTDLDITDKSRKNVASIRLGEARRRLDVAKSNDPKNYNRIAQLRGSVIRAKQAKRNATLYDRGARRAARGETITSNNAKAYLALSGAAIASRLYNHPSMLRTRLYALNTAKIYAPGMAKAVDLIDRYAGVGLQALSVGYAAKKYYDNTNLRAYNRQQWSGKATIKGIGGKEYADVVQRRKEGKTY